MPVRRSQTARGVPGLAVAGAPLPQVLHHGRLRGSEGPQSHSRTASAEKLSLHRFLFSVPDQDPDLDMRSAVREAAAAHVDLR
jgi:hypothetical protein